LIVNVVILIQLYAICIKALALHYQINNVY
ncbi:MAG: hypothetical protein RIR05_999, partial [Bacteroidota bacterium]